MSYKYSKMGKISNIPKVVDFYKNNGFNTTVTVEEKKELASLMDLAPTTKRCWGGGGGGRVKGPWKINEAFLDF